MSFDYRNSNPVGIILVIVTIAGLLGALAMGSMVAHNDFTKLTAIFGLAAGIALLLFLGRNVWLLIPLCWPLTGKIQVLPIPLNVQELAILAAFGFYIALLVFKKPLHRPRAGWMEFWMVLNLIWIASVFFRNPVGMRALGSDMLGGRPYFEILIAGCAFWVLTRTIIPSKQARFFPILMAAGSLLVSVIGTLTTFFPRLTPLVAPFYSGVDTTTYLQEEFKGGGSTSGTGRLTQLRSLGTELPSVLYALFRPFTLLNPIKILPFLLFFIGIAALFLSGFRSALIGTGAAFVLASYFWGGMQEAFRAVFLAIAAVVLLIAAQSAGIQLPLSAQRALSFLPGDWDQTAIQEAEGTTEWRIDMWKAVIDNPDKFLKNPFFGTGFGFSAEDLAIQMQAAFGGQGYIGGTQFEGQLMTGAFHNGPLSTIRFVGIVGLLLYYTLIIIMAVSSVRLVNRARGSPYFYLAVYLSVPSIYGIFSFTFIYGAFDGALQSALFFCAMLRCTSESLQSWQENQEGSSITAGNDIRQKFAALDEKA